MNEEIEKIQAHIKYLRATVAALEARLSRLESGEVPPGIPDPILWR